VYSPTRSRILDSLFVEAVRVRSSGYDSLVEELELPERAGGAGDAPVEPSGPVPAEQRREGHRGTVAPRLDAPEGSELGRQDAGTGPSRSAASCAPRATLLTLRTATPSPLPWTSRVPLEQSANTQSRQGKKGRRVYMPFHRYLLLNQIRNDFFNRLSVLQTKH